MDTVIFGGGVAGLTTAAALLATGRSARVYERRRSGAAGGLGFILSPRALRDLAEVGLPHLATQAGVPLRQFRRYHPDGRLRLVQEMPDGWRAMRRTELVLALQDRLPEQAVTSGAALAGLTIDPDGRVTGARLDRGGPARQSLRADLYVAADGVRSVGRRVLYPGWPAQPARVWEVVAAARDAEVSAWTGGDFHKFSAPGVAAGVVPVAEQTVVWFIQFDQRRVRFPAPGTEAGPVGVPVPANGPEVARLACRLIGSWAYPLPRLLQVTDFERVHVWRPVDADLLPQFHSGNLALVGDAAHPLLPFTSQGVAAAIAGARDLATALARHRCLDAALAAYSASCRVRCAPFISQGRELTRQFLHPDGRTGDLLPVST